MTVVIGYEEQFIAWGNWWLFWERQLGRKFKGHSDELGGYPAYQTFVGSNPFASKHVSNDVTDGYLVDDEAARKIRMLCSPHWETILLAYCVLKGINHDGNQPG